ncbi:MAG TPA: tripartite tricarboxylate transporter substrate binding protein [Burkholderiales bacterium]
MKNPIRDIATAMCIALPMLSAPASAQKYPERPIRAIVVFPPGGPTDTVARIFGQKLTEAWGQQVVVDNRPGAGGNIGMGLAARATGDGYTLLFVSSSLMVNPSLYKKIPYDVYKSFIPVSVLAASTHVWFTHPSLPVKSIADLIALAKRDPSKATVATPGAGTVPHLSVHLLAIDSKTNLVTVPYAGGGPSIAAVLGIQVSFGCQAIPPVTPHIQAGRVRALAITAAKRSQIVPDVPTMAELGFKGHEAETISALLVPAGTPAAIVKRLHSEAVRIMALPDVNKKITDLGADVIANSPQQFTAYIKSEVARWGKVIRDAKIVVN